jgi:hypothetical protein
MSVVIGDLNGDKIPSGCRQPGSTDVSVLLGAGDGNFGSETRYAAGGFLSRIAIGFVDGDRPDLIVVSSTSAVRCC